jgi:hypothetical protein
VRGSTTSTPSATSYNFAVVSGGAEVNYTQVTFANLSFNDGGLSQVAGDVNVKFDFCTVRNVSRTTGNGIFFCSSSTTAINVTLTVGNCVVENVAVTQASTGGLIFVSNTLQEVSISQLRSLYKLMELQFFDYNII